MNTKLEQFYITKAEPYKSCLYALRDIILNFDVNLTETINYGMPCFKFKKRHFCYLWTNKKSDNPYILIVEGQNIEHPILVEGNRKRMKTIPINPNQDIPISEIYEIFSKALEFYKTN